MAEKAKDKERSEVFSKNRSDENHDDPEEEKENRDPKENENYKPLRKHRHKKPRDVKLELPVKDFLEEISNISDRRCLSKRARSDLVSSFIQKGGGDLKTVPSSPGSMRKLVVNRFISLKY
jgi:hypothetical protein